MFDNPSAEIISIGTELLLGEITDTNSVYMAQSLRNYGVNVFYMTTVGDNQKRIVEVLRHALDRADIVITCGGLGPTIDDMTRQAVAEATESELVFSDDLLEQISSRFRAFKTAMTDNNRRQAYIPQNAIVIENPVGTAPSFMVDYHGKLVFSLPGVPREMKYLFQEGVIPLIRQRYRLGLISVRKLRVAGIGESSLDNLIGEELLNYSNPTVGLAAHHGTIDVRITAKAETRNDCDLLIADMEQKLKARISDYIFGYDDDVLEEVLSQSLNQHHLRLKIVQCGLGDTLHSTLNVLPADDTEILRLDDIRNNASLTDIAENMSGQHQRDGYDASLVLISLPDVDEQSDQDVGSVVLVRLYDQTKLRVYGFGGQSDIAPIWISRWGMAMLWRMIQEVQNEQ